MMPILSLFEKHNIIFLNLPERPFLKASRPPGWETLKLYDDDL